jgi:coenzyme F420-reducing hydrogenase beta subunit
LDSDFTNASEVSEIVVIRRQANILYDKMNVPIQKQLPIRHQKCRQKHSLKASSLFQPYLCYNIVNVVQILLMVTTMWIATLAPFVTNECCWVKSFTFTSLTARTRARTTTSTMALHPRRMNQNCDSRQQCQVIGKIMRDATSGKILCRMLKMKNDDNDNNDIRCSSSGLQQNNETVYQMISPNMATETPSTTSNTAVTTTSATTAGASLALEIPSPNPLLSNTFKLASSPQPINPVGWPMKFPAKEHCSKCGLCETTFVRNVTSACSFLPRLGMSRLDELEVNVHGRARDVDSMVWSSSSSSSFRIKKMQSTDKNQQLDSAEEGRFGILHEPVRLVRGINMPDAQWTGVVTSIAVAMLESKQVDAVVCIASSTNNNTSNGEWCSPEPILAKTVQDVLLGRGVKPSLAPSLRVLDEIKNDPSVRKLLFCGVGCSVQAFRAIQKDLNLDQVYVLGTNCVDNSPTPRAAEQFIRDGMQLDAMEVPSHEIQGYEFMQDFRVHVKTSNEYFTKPYFSLPASIAKQAIAQSCLACFDYTNALADVVIGYMGAPLSPGAQMNESYQTLTVRNHRGSKMIQTTIDLGRLEIGPVASSGGDGGRRRDYEQLVVSTVASDPIVQSMMTMDTTSTDTTTKQKGMPVWIGEILAYVLRSIGPNGINFARYSIDYHILRNYLHVLREGQTTLHEGPDDVANTLLPSYCSDIVNHYMANDKNFRELVAKIVEHQK